LKKEERIYHRKKTLSFNKWPWENWIATWKRMKLVHLLTSHTKINLKWIKDLNVRTETIKILEKSISSNFFDISHSNFFLGMSPEARETKSKTIETTSK